MIIQEGISKLWSMIRHKLEKNGNKSVAICSASKGEGSTTVTMSLGKFVAQHTGKNVLLVDAGNLGSQLVDLLGDHELVPLIEEPEDHYQFSFTEFATGIPNLGYLKFQDLNFLETQLGNSEELEIFVRILKKRYDYIFVDAPPVLDSSVCTSLASGLDGVLFVIEAGNLRYPMLEEIVSRFDDSHDRLLGAFLNKRKFPLPKFLYRWIR